jgi:molecular chaperone DnaK
MVDDLIDKTKQPCIQAMKDAGLNADKIHEAILVGGSTRIPKTQELVKSLFGKEPHRGVNPDEVVALGAAVQGGVLSGDVKDILLLDVTPLSLGIETLGGVTTRLIERNTTIPSRKSETFSTASDNQPSVEINVLQGEREMAKDNRSLGKFHLDGIPPAPRGVPQVEVTFDIDANGILHVSAKDKGTGKEQKITITDNTGLNDSEIENMVKDAETNAEADKKRREAIDAKNQLDSLIYSTEKSLRENKDKLSEEDVKKAEEALTEARKHLDSEDADTIKQQIDALTQVSHDLAQKMYSQSQPSEEGGDPSAGGGSDDGSGDDSEGGKKEDNDDVVDAEFEDISNKK